MGSRVCAHIHACAHVRRAPLPHCIYSTQIYFIPHEGHPLLPLLPLLVFNKINNLQSFKSVRIYVSPMLIKKSQKTLTQIPGDLK